MGEDPLIGRVLAGSYRLVRKIGEGGMGAVYLAEHTRLRKKVAIKTLHREISANEEAYRRFRREAEITSELGHPHIIEVHDFDHTEDGLPYMVMEYLEGEDLDALLRRQRRLDVEHVVLLVREVASALQAAHEKGVVHRDLKPQNIFLCRFGERTDFPKVLDFGISKIRGSHSIVTQTQSYLGTPFYMAPEQALGRAAEADARTDVFALGAIMYRLLTGRDAFSGDSLPAVMYQIVHGHPDPVHEVSPDVPVPVSEVVRQAMCKDPDHRFESVAQLSQALTIAAGLDVQSYAPLKTTLSGAAPVPPTVSATSMPGHLTTLGASTGEKVEGVPFRPRRGRRVLFAVAGLAVVGIALPAVYLATRQEADHTSGRPGPSKPSNVAAQQPSSPGPPSKPASLPVAARTHRDLGPRPGQVTVRLVGLPPGGSVTLDGKAVTDNPFTVPRSGRTGHLEVTGRAGVFSRDLALAADQTVQVKLRPRPGARKHSPRVPKTAPTKGAAAKAPPTKANNTPVTARVEPKAPVAPSPAPAPVAPPAKPVTPKKKNLGAGTSEF